MTFHIHGNTKLNRQGELWLFQRSGKTVRCLGSTNDTKVFLCFHYRKMAKHNPKKFKLLLERFDNFLLWAGLAPEVVS